MTGTQGTQGAQGMRGTQGAGDTQGTHGRQGSQGMLGELMGAIRRAVDGGEGIPDPVVVVETCVRLANKARREGLLAIESDLQGIDDPLLREGIAEVVDGTPPRIIQEVLAARVAAMERRHGAMADLIQEGGRLAVALGAVGALLGAADALASDRAADRRAGLAGAARTAAAGVAAAWLVCRPLAVRLRRRSAQEAAAMRVATAGVLGIQAGNAPRLLRTVLEAQLSPVDRGRVKEVGLPSRRQAEGDARRAQASQAAQAGQAGQGSQAVEAAQMVEAGQTGQVGQVGQAGQEGRVRLDIKQFEDYEDLARLGHNIMLRVLRTAGMENRELALALRGSSAGVREAVLRAMSRRAAAAMADEIEALHTHLDALGPEADKVVTDAKQNLLTAARRVAAEERAEEAKYAAPPGAEGEEEPLFESLLTLTDAELRRVLREINLRSATHRQEVVTALRGASAALREKVIRSVYPPEIEERLRREIEESEPARVSAIAHERRRIMETVQRLAEQNEIFPPALEPDTDTSTYPFEQRLEDEAVRGHLTRVLREMSAANDLGRVAMALRGASPAVRDLIFAHASDGIAQQLREDLEGVGPQRRAAIEMAQERLIAALTRLAGGDQLKER